MNKTSKYILSLSILLSINTFSLHVSANTLNPKDSNNILISYQDKNYDDFNKFINQIYIETKDNSMKNSIELFNKKKIVYEKDWLNIYRLMGIYSRIKYKDSIINTLSELVEIQTDKKDDLPQYKNLEIIKFGQKIEKLAQNFGLDYKNIDNRIFEVTLKGSSKEEFGVYTHADVVPVDYSRWVLPDNTKLNPFKLTIIENKLYGRGTEDDKCSIVTSLYAMKSIKENNLPIKRTIKLMIETTEETSGEGIEYYKERYKVPSHNIVLDSAYPLVTAEKGSGNIIVKYDIKPSENTDTNTEITNITGGLAYNHIPSVSIIDIKTKDPKELKKIIDHKSDIYIKENGNDFKIDTTIESDILKVTVIGKSGHSAGPQNSINPVARACEFIYLLDKDINFKNNSFKNAAFFISENFGLDYYGKKLNIDYKDDFMGVLTLTPTLIKVKNNELEIAINIRSPRGKEPDDLKEEITNKLVKYQNNTKNPFKLVVKVGKYMYRDMKGNWINTLLDTYSGLTGNEAKPLSISGTTTAKQLPNGVCFGPTIPGEKYTGHTDNEFKKIENFLFDLQIFTEMFLRIGNLENMD